MGGIVVIFSFFFGLFSYLLVNSLILNELKDKILLIYALSTTSLMVGIIGIIDDLLGWKIGLRQRYKPLLTALASFPFSIGLAFSNTREINLLGLNLTLITPLVFLLGLVSITGTSNAFNLIAGFNGLEALMGITIVGFLSLYSYLEGVKWVAYVGLVLTSSILGFLPYNFYRAKVFPGDTFTYFVGSIIGGLVLISNSINLGLILFLPYFFDFFVHLVRGKLKKEAFGIPREDGSLDLPYSKPCKVTHFAILLLKRFGFKPTERKVVGVILGLEIVLGLIGLVLLLNT